MKYADVMRMYRNKYLGAWDLIDAQGQYRELTFVIDRVAREELVRQGGERDAKPVLYLRVKSTGKPFRVPAVLSKRNAKAFVSTLKPGDDWEGREITFFVEDRVNFGESMPTLSVRGRSRRGDQLKRQLAAEPPPDDDVPLGEPTETTTREPGEEG